MRRSTLVALTGLAGLMVSVCGVQVRPTSVPSPSRTSFQTRRRRSSPDPNLEIVQNNCTACHSADYVQTQPRGPKFKQDFWQAEVTKMIKVYGAPINEADVGKIVDYLAQTY